MTSAQSFDGTVALVTGASSGIGEATARMLAQRGAAVAVQRTAAELGRLDVLVNNAGVMLLGPILDAPVEEWETMVQLNLLGLLYTAHAALPHLLEAASGEPRQVADMVNISSVAGRVARVGSGVYNATKHAVGAFSESLSRGSRPRTSPTRSATSPPGRATWRSTSCWSAPPASRAEARQL